MAAYDKFDMHFLFCIFDTADGYCDMLIAENGLDIINTALRQPDVRDDVANILTRILELTRNFK